ncbi:nuclear transport factor 2 family protein [Rhabdaerophilum calidifontis]|uniref:nuclear transport factor 2 family protein n=1 Tax=Rhabdaerophilum calidifontis TaxID=2604328 RepID=UPI00123B494B|nr:nuclear transport factor 2 family protein [Rhabdaerophilum calidifontis]
MTIQETAEAFTALLKAGDHQGAAERFNADDIRSFEAMEGPYAACHGKAAVKAKSDWWFGNHEVHGGTVEGPFINGDQFLLVFGLDFTPKAGGQRVQATEWGLYTVRDGKIAEERFFYPPMA